MFITIEGVEGVGKSTAINFIKKHLDKKNIQAIYTREPGGTANAELIRALLLGDGLIDPTPETELLLMQACRLEHVKNIIRPALADKKVVVSDRFYDASYAYQGGGRGIDVSKIDALRNIFMADITPDLTLLLDAELNISNKRIAKRSYKDRIEQEQHEFFARVKSSYLSLAAQESRFVIINANKSIKQVQAAIMKAIDKVL